MIKFYIPIIGIVLFIVLLIVISACHLFDNNSDGKNNNEVQIVNNFDWCTYILTALTSGIIGYGIAIYVRKYVKTNIETVFDERRIETFDSLMSNVNSFDNIFQQIYETFEKQYVDISVSKILSYPSIISTRSTYGHQNIPEIPPEVLLTIKEDYKIFKKIVDETKNNYEKLIKKQKEFQLDHATYSIYISRHFLSLVNYYMGSTIEYSTFLVHGECISLYGENRLVESREIRNYLERKSNMDFKRYNNALTKNNKYALDRIRLLKVPSGASIVYFIDKWKKYECDE